MGAQFGRIPDTAVTGGGTPITDYTAPAATTVNLSYQLTMMKLAVFNDGTADVLVKMGAHGCDPTDYTIRLAPGELFSVGAQRPHYFTRLSIYCYADGIWYGSGKNLTIEGWN